MEGRYVTLAPIRKVRKNLTWQKPSTLLSGWPSAFSVMNKDYWNGTWKNEKDWPPIQFRRAVPSDHLTECEGISI
jgi:hypothetical protein